VSNGNENNDWDSGYYSGKDFARRSTPRLPSRRETEEIANAFAEVFDYDFEEAWAIVLRAYVAIFDKYKSEDGFVTKVACVQYETGVRNFDHYSWTGGFCSLIKQAE
jgi:hypothetical protein